MAEIEAKVISALESVGEYFIADARTDGSYEDQSSDLRNSIGYIIMKNGQQIRYAGPREGGKASADRVLAELALKYPKGYVLIAVAGMDYAAAVESKGYDVLSGSAPAAVARLKEAMERITKKTAEGR